MVEVFVGLDGAFGREMLLGAAAARLTHGARLLGILEDFYTPGGHGLGVAYRTKIARLALDHDLGHFR